LTDINVKCRFAPAPTGFLHMGSAHTAFFSWLYAKQNNGKFILRLEDSDQSLSSDIAWENIKKDLFWLGLIDQNTEIYRQSERIKLGIYTNAIKKLKEKNLIKETKSESGVALLYIPPEKEIIIEDIYRNPIHAKFSNSSDSLLSPFIIVRSDGWPVYNFACVVDDIDMGITHIIRGDDILPSTAKQISLYNALDAKLPILAHLPRVLDKDGKPLSKKGGSKSIDQFKKEGYLPEAILNYLALLGWSPPAEKQILSIDEICEYFNLYECNISKVQFDIKKLNFINAKHIRSLKSDELAYRLNNYFIDNNLQYSSNKEWLNNYCKYYANRCITLNELSKYIYIYFHEIKEYDKSLLLKCIFNNSFLVLNKCLDIINKYSSYSENTINKIRKISKKYKISFSKIAMCLRIALTNSNTTPDLIALFNLLGLKKINNRINIFIKLLKLQDFEKIESYKTLISEINIFESNLTNKITNLKSDKQTIKILLNNLKDWKITTSLILTKLKLASIKDDVLPKK
jgi:glutamyl-tRNA synthetase